ncbi:hypothetical protein [Photobacterium galatheae]|nr:hypothetical protein [Photobacterium galatheae]
MECLDAWIRQRLRCYRLKHVNTG